MEDTLRKELHEMIDNFSEEKLQEVYELLQEDEYSDEIKRILDEEYEDYERTGEAVSKEEADKIIQAILYKKINACLFNYLLGKSNKGICRINSMVSRTTVRKLQKILYTAIENVSAFYSCISLLIQ